MTDKMGETEWEGGGYEGKAAHAKEKIFPTPVLASVKCLSLYM